MEWNQNSKLMATAVAGAAMEAAKTEATKIKVSRDFFFFCCRLIRASVVSLHLWSMFVTHQRSATNYDGSGS